MNYWIQRDNDGYVHDVIEYEYGNYEPIEYNDVLPNGVLSGYFKFENGNFILDEEKKQEIDDMNKVSYMNDLEDLRNRLFDLESKING